LISSAAAALISWADHSGSAKAYEIYRLPDKLEQQYRQHLHWVSKSQCGSRAEASQQGDLNSSRSCKLVCMVDDGGPDILAKAWYAAAARSRSVGLAIEAGNFKYVWLDFPAKSRSPL
jgi:hypothetical protein